jgi:hypothetical protein
VAGPRQNAAFERAFAALRTGKVMDAESLLKDVLRAAPATSERKHIIHKLIKWSASHPFPSPAIRIGEPSDSPPDPVGSPLSILRQMMPVGRGDAY